MQNRSDMQNSEWIAPCILHLHLHSRRAPHYPLRPSPTGYLHLGHIVNAIYVWGLAPTLRRTRAAADRRSRSDPQPSAFEAAILEDLAWLGFVPDEGLNPFAARATTTPRTRHALATLAATHNVYACDCSRKEIRLARYPGRAAQDGCARRRRSAWHGVRVQLDDQPESFTDGALGEIVQTPATMRRSLCSRDRDGNWTYQFAVTVDDMNDECRSRVRGWICCRPPDGRSSSRDARPHRAAHFFHHPLIIKPDGEKLSKAAATPACAS
jgi:glutamyl-tRNA synthetase/glutamyl-Q tRNA(Asp) synthetase